MLSAIGFLGLLVLGNQHRLQPWVYHFLLSAWALVFLPRARAHRWLLLLLASVYFYSALNKCDRRFLETTGEMMIRTLVQWFDSGARAQPPRTFAQAALLLPLGEFMTGALILWPRTIGIGRVLAVLLHGGLLLILGPWGMHHRWGVLVWNVAFLSQCLYLASRSRNDRETNSPVRGQADCPTFFASSPFWQRVGWAPLLVAMVAPIFEPWGWWDHWPSWGLYSARATKVELYLSDEIASQLPGDLRPYVEATPSASIWRRLPLDRWSLDVLETPIYPQSRFQWGVVRAILSRVSAHDGDWMAVATAAPDRRSGQAKKETVVSNDELEKMSGRFWFNTKPR